MIRVKGLKERHKEIINDTSPKALFSKSQFITLVGHAGSGKSTFLRKLFLDCLEDKVGLPILIELRKFSEINTDIESHIYEYLVEQQRIFETKKQAYKSLKKGNLVFLFDGYDEIPLRIKTIVVQNIKTFIDKYNNNKFIISARPDSTIDFFHFSFDNYYVSPLSIEGIKDLIDKNFDGSDQDKLTLKKYLTMKKRERNILFSFPLYIFSFS